MSRYVMTLSLLLVSTAAACTDEEINAASQTFKDCVDKKELELIRMDRKKSKEEKETYICDKLGEISTKCHKALAKCRSREYVDDKVAIHINSISGIMKSVHSDISLETCPVLMTPEPPTIVQQGGEEGQKPEYEPVTGSATTRSLSTFLALAGVSLAGWVRRATN